MVPTVNVSVNVFDQDGLALAGAEVIAELVGTDTYNNQLVGPIKQTVLTDAAGLAVIPLFPNSLGARNSFYRFKVTNLATGHKLLDTTAAVPNAACNLATIAGNLKQLYLAELPFRVQPFSDVLTSFASLVGAADTVPYFTGPSSYALASFTVFGRSLVGSVSAAAARGVLSVPSSAELAAAVAVLQPLDPDLTQVAALAGTGFVVRTAADTWAQRSLANAAAGLTWTNPAGVAGNPTPVLANDLAAVEGLAGTGLAVRSAVDTWVQRSIANATAGITWTNPDGVSGNPTPVLANDLAALEGLSSTGIGVRTGTDAWAQRSIVAGTGVSVANGDGVGGNPSISTICPQNSRSANYTTVLGDAEGHIYHPSTDNNPRTYTIDSNASVPYAVGSELTFVNEINTVTIGIAADTLTLAGSGATGNRTLAANGIATALKVAATKWVISGVGLS